MLKYIIENNLSGWLTLGAVPIVLTIIMTVLVSTNLRINAEHNRKYRKFRLNCYIVSIIVGVITISVFTAAKVHTAYELRIVDGNGNVTYDVKNISEIRKNDQSYCNNGIRYNFDTQERFDVSYNLKPGEKGYIIPTYTEKAV